MRPPLRSGAWLLLGFLAALPPAQAGWRLVREGDCLGEPVGGSVGAEPEAERCTPAFAGKTAVCFSQVCYPGCQYVDVTTRDCREGSDRGWVYTCRPGVAE